jgi:hypothetical protein
VFYRKELAKVRGELFLFFVEFALFDFECFLFTDYLEGFG